MLNELLQLVLKSVFGFLTVLFLLRFLMQSSPLNFRHRSGEFIIRMTDPLVKPLRRVLPGFLGWDWASLVSALLIQVGLTGLPMALTPVTFSLSNRLLVVLTLGALGVFQTLISLMMALVVIMTLLCWMAPHAPAYRILTTLTEPFLRPFRRFLPYVAGVDLSPFVFVLLCEVLSLLLNYLQAFIVRTLS